MSSSANTAKSPFTSVQTSFPLTDSQVIRKRPSREVFEVLQNFIWKLQNFAKLQKFRIMSKTSLNLIVQFTNFCKVFRFIIQVFCKFLQRLLKSLQVSSKTSKISRTWWEEWKLWTILFWFAAHVYQSFVFDLSVVEGQKFTIHSPWTPHSIQLYSNVTWSYDDPVGATRMQLNLTSASHIRYEVDEVAWESFALRVLPNSKSKLICLQRENNSSSKMFHFSRV